MHLPKQGVRSQQPDTVPSGRPGRICVRRPLFFRRPLEAMDFGKQSVPLHLVFGTDDANGQEKAKFFSEKESGYSPDRADLKKIPPKQKLNPTN